MSPSTTTRMAAVGLLGLLAILGATPAAAHEVRPAYWEIQETEPGLFNLIWKQPVFADEAPGIARRLPIDPVVPSECEIVDAGLATRTTGAIVQRSVARCPEGIVGLELRVAGLQRTLMDVLLRIQLLDGSTHTALLKPSAPTYVLGTTETTSVPAYLRLGVEHMLQGFDHLLFVLGLVLLSRKTWEVIRLITAFTVAHSITLGLVATGYLALPQGPVEAAIALSILFLAVETLQPPEQRSFLAQNSWTVAFGFGLLHGFGFAGALAEIGLPQNAAIPALFLFNVGVEIGQLVTVLVFLLITSIASAMLRKREQSLFAAAKPTAIAATLVGTISAYWFVQRFLGLW